MPNLSCNLQGFAHSHFVPDPFGHGGNKRTCQIKGLLETSSINFQAANFHFDDGLSAKINKLFNWAYAIKDRRGNLQSRYMVKRYTDAFERFIEIHQPALFVWESTIDYYLLLAKVLHQYGIPFIALPHNIESTLLQSKSILTGNTGDNWLIEELSYLDYAAHTYTISIQERSILLQNAITANYLPYYPCKEAEKFLLSIRSKRINSSVRNKKTNVLLLGTFYNLPTADGYTELLHQISHIENISINIAGYGSEKIKSGFLSNSIKPWGSVNKETLEKLIIEADVAIVHQQSGAGALTRIPEFILAGLPILANNIAARSTDHLSGIEVYNNFNELKTLLESKRFAIPALPDRPVQEQGFINYLNSLVG